MESSFGLTHGHINQEQYSVPVTVVIGSAHQNWYLLLGTGFCGGYTTFSTFEWETYKLVRDGSWWYALANAFGSLLAGFIGILLAVALVGAIFPKE